VAGTFENIILVLKDDSYSHFNSMRSCGLQKNTNNSAVLGNWCLSGAGAKIFKSVVSKLKNMVSINACKYGHHPVMGPGFCANDKAGQEGMLTNNKIIEFCIAEVKGYTADAKHYTISRFTPKKNEPPLCSKAQREAKIGKTLVALDDMFKEGLLDKKLFEATKQDVLDIGMYEALFPP